ncbi:vitelline envelope sperm lysin receptor-like [Haliotis rubra]|uniref:vitelline envelope sperm lysin receptor-like n=1 Tax=Haliotis rubra TaxID=36100 RepID=UPI001EE5CAE0|nr:vitelline envelope sperm lysin receptor-like [Haliotis rubra]XP_046553522.1 vitelline envelope sperm lysin receptor-like [Haliotis rubra]XP_046553523.1 vitelline envelope sperm lysin receptor-like [Haliotis rubra]
MTAGLCLLPLLLACLSVLLGITTAAIPKGYTLQVTPLCSTSIDGGATITIKTDLNVDANAYCQQGTPVGFKQVDDATLTLDVAYPGSKSTKACTFKQRENSQVYFIRVVVSYGEIGAEVHTDDEVVTVTCTLDPRGSKTSGKKVIKGRVIAPKEIVVNKGAKSKSKLKLLLTDIARQSLNGRNINLGRKVLLIASTDGSSGEKGIRITSCDAIGQTTGKRYQVIRAGCGDGQVFKKTLGFVTTGLTAMSPYFDMFHLDNDKIVTFDCNFTLCKTQCDGSSCENQRRRRSPNHVVPAAFINSAPSPFKTRFQRSAYKEEHTKIFLTNVAGYKLHNVSLQRGRPYVLHAVTDGKKGEVGLQVMRCDIVTTRIQHNLRMAAIRDGCGVEPVFRPDQGFITSGLTATSPYFKGFSIRGDKSLTFECDVILCHQNCDGRTCIRQRKKRELEKQELFLESGSIQSASYIVNPRAKRSRSLRHKDMLEAV